MRSYEPGAPETIKMGSHLTKHGDGVKDVAFRYTYRVSHMVSYKIKYMM